MYLNIYRKLLYSGSSGDVNQSWINCQALRYGFGSGSASRLHHEFCLHPELNQALKQQRENKRTEMAQRTSKQHGFPRNQPFHRAYAPQPQCLRCCPGTSTPHGRGHHALLQGMCWARGRREPGTQGTAARGQLECSRCEPIPAHVPQTAVREWPRHPTVTNNALLHGPMAGIEVTTYRHKQNSDREQGTAEVTH